MRDDVGTNQENLVCEKIFLGGRRGGGIQVYRDREKRCLLQGRWDNVEI